jgi:hypothetical protein
MHGVFGPSQWYIPESLGALAKRKKTVTPARSGGAEALEITPPQDWIPAFARMTLGDFCKVPFSTFRDLGDFRDGYFVCLVPARSD